MRVLIATPDLYKEDYPEFVKNKTGFGLMVYDILTSVSEKEDTYLISNKLTKGYPCDGIIPHTLWDVVGNMSLRDFAGGIHDALRYRQSIKGRLKYLFYRLNKGYIRHVVKELGPDIVHIQSIGFASLPYIEVCRELGVPFLVTLHGLVGLDASSLASEEDRLLEKEFLASLRSKNEFASIVSTGSRNRVLAHYSKDAADNLIVVSNGTDAVKGARNLLSFESTLSILLPPSFSRSGAYRFVVVGNICERKNQIQILEALHILKDITEKDFVVVFCGADTLGRMLQEKVKELNLVENVACTGSMPKEDVYALYDWASCNVVASRDEGFGLSVIEAASFGIPTVAFSDIDAMDDLYDPRSMIRIDDRSTVSLANGLAEALDRKWDSEAIRQFAQRFSLDVMAERYIEVYDEAISRQTRVVSHA